MEQGRTFSEQVQLGLMHIHLQRMVLKHLWRVAGFESQSTSRESDSRRIEGVDFWHDGCEGRFGRRGEDGCDGDVGEGRDSEGRGRKDGEGRRSGAEGRRRGFHLSLIRRCEDGEIPQERVLRSQGQCIRSTRIRRCSHSTPYRPVLQTPY
jgi:hypothetical protein